MKRDQLLKKALNLEFLSAAEGQYLFENTPVTELMFAANELRKIHKPGNNITWMIDRNVNITNICITNCKFCNFSVPPNRTGKNGNKGYITSIDEYKEKIEELFRYGGNQLLLQGGHHPGLGLDFYTGLFRELKKLYPELKLHALGPPEIAHICKLEGKSHTEVLTALTNAGLDTLPGAGAEILNDRVRRLISKKKCSSKEWLDIMHTAHQLNITTSATMMFGHMETIEERFEHLVLLRNVQSEKPEHAKGFLAFIPWTFQDENTILKKVKGITNKVTADEYIKMIAISRIMLPNIINIQASWLTVGIQTAQLCLHAGANDLGSIMIEENVVSAAGASYRFTSKGIQQAIREAEFEPQLRSQEYEYRE
ncbi:MAG: CofH family radical SAM protein [Bacteroidota bacterium]